VLVDYYGFYIFVAKLVKNIPGYYYISLWVCAFAQQKNKKTCRNSQKNAWNAMRNQNSIQNYFRKPAANEESIS
jgi:hypothetical protein